MSLVSYILVPICFLFLLINNVCEGVVLDLTHKLSEETIVWPRLPPFQLTEAADVKMEVTIRGKVYKSRFYMNQFSSGEHIGTHMDAPSHFNYKADQAWNVDQIPVERLIAPAVVVNISSRAEKDPDATLGVSDLESWEANHGRIPDHSVVLLSSGWDLKWPDANAVFGTNVSANISQDELWSSLHFPGFSVDATSWLLENRNIYGVGTDTPSIDPGNAVAFKSHILLSKENKYNLEFVNNVHKIPPVGATLYAMPIFIRGGSGGPTRIVATWDEEKVGCGASGLNLPYKMILLLLLNNGIILLNQI